MWDYGYLDGFDESEYDYAYENEDTSDFGKWVGRVVGPAVLAWCVFNVLHRL